MNKIAKELIKIAKELLIAGGVAVNRQTEFFKTLTPIGKRNGRATYKNKLNLFYQWDSLHGEWEVFNKEGRHLGAADINGKPTKEAVKTRRIKL